MMKHPRKLLLSVLLLLALLFFGGESLVTYLGLGSHTYYTEMLSSRTNRGIFISAIVCALPPLLYLLRAKRCSVKRLTILLGAGVAVFGLIHSMRKGGTVGFGWFLTIFNSFFLFALGAYTLTGFFALGSWIERKWLHFTQHRWQELLLTLGIGLIVFLAGVQILLGIGVLYGIVSWILFLGLGFLMYWERKTLKARGEYLGELLGGLKEKAGKNTPRLITIGALILISLVYWYYGFQNSFIPYSTAWDANHEYMYTPKMIAENNGVMRGNTVISTMPGMWHMLITYFFSLTGLTNGRLGLAPDTIAVSMNFLSGVLTLLLGIGLVYQISELFRKKEEKEEKVGLVAGRSTILLWLTSGMGAFLVMVDNKTDLGVMALSLLALLAGMIFLGIVQREASEKKEIWRYLIIAGIFFAFATLAKSTAFVDLALFGVFLIGLWISPRSAVGVGLGLTGILRYMNILTSSFMITEGEAKWLIIIGSILMVVGIALARWKKRNLGTSIGYLLVLGISFLVPLALFRVPWLTVQQLSTDTFSPKAVVKGLFAQAITGNIEQQNNIDEQFLNEQTTENRVKPVSNWQDGQRDANACLSSDYGWSEEELKEGLQEVKGGGLVEDFGRYIGFGWKEFAPGNGTYALMKLLFPTSDHCYGTNTEAKLLCANSEAIDNFQVATLKKLYAELPDKASEGAVLLKEALDAFDLQTRDNTTAYEAQAFRDQIVALRQYYQSHSIKSTAEVLAIPYRYIVPVNIVFNWSLQNLSSYYTDIGFARILMFILLVVSLPYALVKREKNLIVLSCTTLLGRAIWWIIGSAILRYGTVLISRTAMTLLAFANTLWAESQKSKEKSVSYLMLGIFGVVALALFIQLVLNFFRISSQGASGPFVWYKGNMGTETQFTEGLETKQKVALYTAKDVFNLQFPQYNPIITALKERKNDEGIVIAGTYLQYFLNNQWNLQGDGLLANFRVKASDGNLCKTYRRLKNDHIKYLVIDPNIGTVGMGEGNETLFHRFFAKLDPVSGGVEQDGTLTTLVKMYALGYVKLLSTNNIGAYYSFNLSDGDISTAFGATTPEEIVLVRAKLIGIRYFSEEVNTLFNQIANVFLQRIMAGQGFEEIASIYGLEIDVQKVANVALQVMQSNFSKLNGVEELSQAERTVLIQYLNLYKSFSNSNTQVQSQGQQMLQNILMTSIGSSSQVMLFELI